MNTLIDHAPIRHFSSIDSTNSEAARQWQAGEHGPLFLLADEQIAGRGRRGRTWASARGNCYSTLLLPLHPGVEVIPQIGFAVALAVADVVKRFAPLSEPKLKWPNDVLVNGAKIAGILSEVVSHLPLAIAIGCGINIAHAPLDLAYPAASLGGLGSNATRDEVFAVYRMALSQWLATWDLGRNFEAIRTAWAKSALGIGEIVSFQQVDEKITGRMEGVDAEGALLLRETPFEIHAFKAGDLHIPSLADLRKQVP